VDFVEHAVKEEEVSSTVWTFNLELFLLNSQKQRLLQHVECYLPRILFCFRPVYGIQLGVRCVIQMLAGTDEEKKH
jgi:hypothetical protein